MKRHGDKVCSCGQGYKSRFDQKCGKCRSNKQRRLHEKWVSIGCPDDITSNTLPWEWPGVKRIEVEDL